MHKHKLNLFRYFSIFFVSSAALFTAVITSATKTTCLDVKADTSFQEIEKKRDIDEEVGISVWLARRLLSGPGSSPPHCNSKCGKCTPCKAAHVLVPPGTPATAEYYPEAWRCMCGNQLYMP